MSTSVEGGEILGELSETWELGVKEWVGEGEGGAFTGVGRCGDGDPTASTINDLRNSTTFLPYWAAF